MELQGELAVRGLDGLLVRVTGDAEDFVIITLAHWHSFLAFAP